MTAARRLALGAGILAVAIALSGCASTGFYSSGDADAVMKALTDRATHPMPDNGFRYYYEDTVKGTEPAACADLAMLDAGPVLASENAEPRDYIRGNNRDLPAGIQYASVRIFPTDAGAARYLDRIGQVVGQCPTWTAGDGILVVAGDPALGGKDAWSTLAFLDKRGAEQADFDSRTLIGARQNLFLVQHNLLVFATADPETPIDALTKVIDPIVGR